jgi:lipopolysaccharide biosynthesis protein
MKNNIRPIAIHLPQFHPIPENDEWWGKGFTEWTNVTKSRPLFEGHYQPHLPSDLGFYDLRLEESRIAQAELAKAYGIEGFCYYHYWFNGKRLLNRPLDDMLKTKTPNFPFMLCWANENWSRRWDGQDHEVLLKQEYSFEDDLQHIRFLCDTFFSDSRYIKKDDKPFFLIYKPHLFPNIRKTIEIWRNEAIRCGVGEIYLGCMQFPSHHTDLEAQGFDCAIEFHPDFVSLPPRYEGDELKKFLVEHNIPESVFEQNNIISYKEYVTRITNLPKSPPMVYPGITPGWDNSSRRNFYATVFVDSSPEEYEKWLFSIKEKYSEEETFLFINAWNEWAEGNHLEPCQKWGRKYLEATKKVLTS